MAINLSHVQNLIALDDVSKRHSHLLQISKRKTSSRSLEDHFSFLARRFSFLTRQRIHVRNSLSSSIILISSVMRTWINLNDNGVDRESGRVMHRMSCYESETTNVFIEEHSAPFATPVARFGLNNSSWTVPAIQFLITIQSLNYLYETLLSFDESGTQIGGGGGRGRERKR